MLFAKYGQIQSLMLALFFFSAKHGSVSNAGHYSFGEVRSDPISNAGTILSPKYGQIQSLMLALFLGGEVRSDPVSNVGTIFGGEVRSDPVSNVGTIFPVSQRLSQCLSRRHCPSVCLGGHCPSVCLGATVPVSVSVATVPVSVSVLLSQCLSR